MAIAKNSGKHSFGRGLLKAVIAGVLLVGSAAGIVVGIATNPLLIIPSVLALAGGSVLGVSGHNEMKVASVEKKAISVNFNRSSENNMSDDFTSTKTVQLDKQNEVAVAKPQMIDPEAMNAATQEIKDNSQKEL